MATLAELGQAYLESAVKLRIGIQRLEERMEDMGAKEHLAAEHDLRLLRQMLRETREVGELVRHYYEPGYWRDRKYIC